MQRAAFTNQSRSSSCGALTEPRLRTTVGQCPLRRSVWTYSYKLKAVLFREKQLSFVPSLLLRARWSARSWMQRKVHGKCGEWALTVKGRRKNGERAGEICATGLLAMQRVCRGVLSVSISLVGTFPAFFVLDGMQLGSGRLTLTSETREGLKHSIQKCLVWCFALGGLS